MLPVTCGVIFVKDNFILLGHSTGNIHWDIPKGMNENGETHLETAIRETYEETGITITETDLEFLGNFTYNAYKNIVLYLCKKPVNPETFNCTSFFLTKHGIKMPEIDALEYVDFTIAINEKVGKAMKTVLINIKDRLFD